MIFLRNQNSENQVQGIALFGVGLIGSSVLEQILQKNFVALFESKVNWGTPLFRDQIDSILKNIDDFINSISQQNSLSHPKQISIIWCAGRAGFYSSETETLKELTDFNTVLSALKSLIEKNLSPSKIQLEVHLLSSAGGLFEGQSDVDKASLPNPTRPYGKLKLAQEDCLIKICQMFNNQILKGYIYRVSSVYGKIAWGKRSGLIATMIQNGYRHQVTQISGDFNTLRDFIHANDVAKRILKNVFYSNVNENGKIQKHQDAYQIELVISNKPTSIFEIKSIIEFYLKKRLYINMQFSPTNSKNITFKTDLSNNENQCVDLRVGIKDLITRWNEQKQKPSLGSSI